MTKCQCTGPLCQCEASGVVKDGRGVSVRSFTMDSQQPSQQPLGITTDAELQVLRDRSEAARDHMIHQLSNSWKSPDAKADTKDAAPKLHHARDGRALDQLTDSERAREEYIHRLSNGWRG